MLSTENNNYKSFTCSTCKATFDDNEAQRAHYKEDWHKYNLKRKIAGLPSITELEFIEINNNDKPKNKFSCDICNKTFHNENTLKDHNVSKKHIENVANYEKNKINKIYTSSDDESGEDLSDDNDCNGHTSKEPKINWKKKFAEAKTDEEFNKVLNEKIKASKKIEENECLFCNFKGQTFEEKMKHMIDEHTFYVPDMEYLSDLKGLMNYLAQKISIGNTCIYCHRMFHSLEAIRKHMTDKGHTKISYEEGPDLEIAAFYDFSSLSDDSDEDQNDNSNENENSKALTVTSEGTELILPSGAHIGHRDYKRYYNQNLRNYNGSNSKALMPLSEKYKALGYYEIGSSGMTIEKERLEKMKETRKQLKKYGKERQSLGVKNNDFFIAWGRLGSFKRVFLQ